MTGKGRSDRSRPVSGHGTGHRYTEPCRLVAQLERLGHTVVLDPVA